jgi:Chitobiase/beta-hexosaminidase C-terminal domain
MLAGCGYTGTSTPAIALGGSVHGGHQPVSGSTIQLYAAGTSGNGSAAQALLSDPVKTDSNGNFSIPATYSCPSSSSQVYIVAQGGNPGLPSGTNPALVLMAMLGPCSGLSASGSVSINEVTTVGALWPLAAYMTDATHLGSASGDASFLTAAATVPEFVNNAQGTSPGTPTATSSFTENAKLYSLSDILANCVNSGGGAAGDGSPCGTLFSTATPSGANAPADTVAAALRIAQNPKNNVDGIYGLVGGNTTFQPALTAAPTDWALSLSFAVATPTISLPTGTYTGAQQVTLSDSTAGSTIYYTTNGTVPTTSSPTYAGPIAIGVTTTVQAIAVLQGSQSSVASSTLTISPTLLQAKLVFVQQPSNAVAQSTIAPAVTVAVEDINGNLVPVANDAVQITLVGGTGLLSGTLVVTPQNGVATFNNLSVDTAGTGYTLVATSPSLPPAISSPFNISAAGSGTPTTPVKLAFLQQPSNAVTGATIAPAVTVVVEDSNGNPVPSATNPVTVALTTGTGLTGTLTATPQNGIATFSNLSASTAGTFTLSATSPNLTSAISTNFTISAAGGGTPPPPAKLAFSQQPSNAATGATITPAVTVTVEDGNGNTVTTATNPVTIALTTGAGLTGTLTAVPQKGIATFSNLTESTAGTYTLTATSPNLVAANSNSFTISAPGGGTPPPPAKLAFSQQPSNASTGATITPAVTVAVQDNNGNTVTTATNPVTLALTTGTGLTGTLTATPQNGIATFSNLAESTAGTYTLSATSPSLTSATSASFTISAAGGGTPAPPAKLAFSQQPSNASTGATITPAVTVAVQDSNGNTVTTATNPVTIALTTGSGLAGTLTATPQNGIATFGNLSESTAGTYTLSATSSGLTSATSASFTISAASSGTGATYYISPSGSDSNNGLSPSAPWLTPKHAVNCGDVISAAPGSYSANNFSGGHWGTVTCPAGNNVAWLQCATFDTCKITTSSSDGIWVDQDYWGVTGWETSTNTTSYGACFRATPSGSYVLHHVIFANDIANGCMGGGFVSYNTSTSAGTDYLTLIGNIAYNGAQASGNCFSGISIYQPIAADTAAGTHEFINGNFSWGNVDPAVCAGGPSTDGEAVIIDTPDFSQGGGAPYTQQIVVENNVGFFNGGRGFEIYNNEKGGTNATIYFKYNTAYGDMTDNNQTNGCYDRAELALQSADNVTYDHNLAETRTGTSCSSAALNGLTILLGNATDTATNNWLYSPSGNSDLINASTGFVLGAGNTVGTNPAFANPVNPGAPSCSGSANVPACMATVIANYTPTVAAAKAYGYQQPSSTSVSDPLFPKWLCSVNLPAGLVTKGCN